MEQVEPWKAAAAPAERRRISEFLWALQARWFMRELFGAGAPAAGH